MNVEFGIFLFYFVAIVLALIPIYIVFQSNSDYRNKSIATFLFSLITSGIATIILLFPSEITILLSNSI